MLYLQSFDNFVIGMITNNVFRISQITWIPQNMLSVARDVYLNCCSKTAHYTEIYS